MNNWWVTRKHGLKLVIACVVLISPGFAQAALFKISFDNVPEIWIYGDEPPNGNTGDIIGTGYFGYDGPVALGSFTLSELSNITFQATFDSGLTFSTEDIVTLFDFPDAVPEWYRIEVFLLPNGDMGMVFKGGLQGEFGGSLDLLNDNGDYLGFEPTYSGRPGANGGDGTTNLYYIGNDSEATAIGNYAAVAVHASGSLVLLALGWGVSLCRRKSQR